MTSADNEFEPIASYGMLSDCSSAALVSRTGSIDWLCLPRFDSPALFARMLDPRAGHWSIRPAGPFESRRRYLPGTLVIETTFTTPTGVARVVDALAFVHGQRGHELGLGAPHELLRSVEGVTGAVDLIMELAPRPEYGLVRPLLRLTDRGARTVRRPQPDRAQRGRAAQRERRHRSRRFPGMRRGAVGLLPGVGAA